MTPDDHPDFAQVLSNYGGWIGRRYERTDLEDDLERAIESAQQAVDMTSNNPLRLDAYLGNLGKWLGDQHTI